MLDVLDATAPSDEPPVEPMPEVVGLDADDEAEPDAVEEAASAALTSAWTKAALA